MNKHTLQLLEFEKIREACGHYCFSPQGLELLRQQRIEIEISEVEKLKGFSLSFRKILDSGILFPELSFPDISSYYGRLEKKGSFLEPEEMLDIGNYLVSAKRLKRFLLKNARETILYESATSLPDLDDLIKEIFKIIGKEGHIKEGKIPELLKIKREINRFRSDINDKVHDYLNNPNYKTYWQTTTSTTRDGRVVLPLKSNFKGRVKGIVHELSSSGATIFLEPNDIVEKNNQIVTLENQYRKVLIKILQELTSLIIDENYNLKIIEAGISLLDSYYARARYAITHNCLNAKYNKSQIVLRNARHPLLGGKVVPVTIVLPPDIRILIITGPNTGGKTVSLKTVAVLSLMNQFGMEIPADEDSMLPIYDDILADIGDEQSIEQSLSTFSGHIRNLSHIISQATDRSLVLLDELGSGTDPEEGVAIAMAILDHFIKTGSTVFSTTHHGILKNYGYTKDGVENACMDFDQKTLVPRYQLIMGVPGDSQALAIATHHGIPENIIKQASAYLNDERSNISELIKKLSEKQKKLIAVEKEHEIKRIELDEKQRMSDLKELRLRQKELEVKEYSLRELNRFLSESRKTIENMVRELREGEISKEKIKNVQEFISLIQSKIDKEESGFKARREEYYNTKDVSIQPGVKVRIKGTGKIGHVLRKGKADTWFVETENLKLSLHHHDLEPVEVVNPKKGIEIQVSSVEDNCPSPVSSLNLLGFRLQEALSELEKQIDRAVIKGLREFYVVHGKGDGILQKGIHDYLKQSAFVADYFFSLPEDGGFGRTIVRLKE